MFIVNNRSFFFWLSGILTALSIVAMVTFGFRFGIEFTGGSLMEVDFVTERPTLEEMNIRLETLELGAQAQQTGEKGYIIRTTKSPSEEERQKLVSAISVDGKDEIDVRRFDSIGPTIGAELRSKAGLAILLVITGIILYIAFAFRHVSQPVSSWTFGMVAIIALVHDVLIPTGIYVTLSHYFLDVQIDVLFVIAILTILGFSIHDTIVVFDRTRENLKLRTWKDFSSTVGHSIEQTFTRSINTSMTVLLVTLALYFIGSETTKNFALILAVGVIAGTYSSVFLASPLLVTFNEWQQTRAAKRK